MEKGLKDLRILADASDWYDGKLARPAPPKLKLKKQIGASVEDKPTHFAQTLSEMKVAKVKMPDGIVGRQATLDVPYKLGVTEGKKTLKVTFTLADFQESVKILHAAGHVFLDYVSRRFVKVGFWPDLQALHDVQWNPRARDAAEPRGALLRVAEHLRVKPDLFAASWRLVAERKEQHVLNVLAKGHKGKDGEPLARKDLRPSTIWPEVAVETHTLAPEARQPLEFGILALDRYLLLEATNAGVERSGASKRLVEECQQGVGGSDLLDARLRILSEGPSVSKNIHSHHVIVEAAKVFLTEKDRRMNAYKKKERPPHGGNQGEDQSWQKTSAG